VGRIHFVNCLYFLPRCRNLFSNRKVNFNKHKYKATRVNFDGYSFASKGEAACYQLLKDKEKRGELKLLRTQVQIYLTKAKILYKPDFECQDPDTNEIFYVEYKGVETPTWRIKRKLWIHYGPGRLIIYKGSYKGRIDIFEELIPEND